jgi:hypothetical protein
MASPPSTAFSGLACSSQPLGLAATPISHLVQAATSDAISQLCERPSDSMYQISPDAITVSFGTELVDLTISMPPAGAVQGSVTCQTAFAYIATQCFDGEGVWGGEWYDGDFTYAIARAAGADALVARLENSVYGLEPVSGVVTATAEASGVVSGLPGPVPSGIASGLFTDVAAFPGPSGVASGYLTDGVSFPMPTAVVPGFYPAASGVASGFYPDASGLVTATGYAASATPGALVFPGDSADAFTRGLRGSGDRGEADAETRPRAKWIVG